MSISLRPFSSSDTVDTASYAILHARSPLKNKINGELDVDECDIVYYLQYNS